jgi:hypothetical protein
MCASGSAIRMGLLQAVSAPPSLNAGEGTRPVTPILTVSWRDSTLPDADLHCVDINNTRDVIAPASVDWVITDPLYGRDYLQTDYALGQLADHALKYDGNMLVMTGLTCLPQCLSLLPMNLSYCWIWAYLTPGKQSANLFHRRVNNF